jgi:MFS transporter, Spinster family, sphingosine-1-phosphate transporter
MDNGRNVTRYSFYALTVLALVNFLNYIDRQIFPAVAGHLIKDPTLKLTDTQIGLIEASLLLSFTIFAPLFGRLGDRRSRTKLLAGAAAAWSIATAVAALAGVLPLGDKLFQIHLPFTSAVITLTSVALFLCIARAIVGIGESAYSTITPSLIADLFPISRRGMAMGVFQAAIPIGFALGFIIGGVLAHFFGWRAAFMIVGVPGLITAVMIWRIKEPVRGQMDIPVHFEKRSFLATAKYVLRIRDYLLSTAGYTALTFTLGTFATWSVILMVRDKGLDETSASIWIGVITLVGGAVGTFGGGYLADIIAARWERGYFLVCGLSSLFGTIPVLIALVSNRPAVYLTAIFFTVLLLFTNNAPFHAILVNSVPVQTRATAIAINILIIHTLGDTISRPVVGILSDLIKEGELLWLTSFSNAIGVEYGQHLSAALLISPVALLISSALFFMGMYRREN